MTTKTHIVATDATRDAAMTVLGRAVGEERESNFTDAGTLGVEYRAYDLAEARLFVRALRAAGFTAWVE